MIIMVFVRLQLGMPLVKRRQKYKIYEIKDKNVLTNRKYIVKIKN